LVMRLRYKTDAMDASCAARIAGYHVTALALIATDPDAEHARQSLLSAEELRFQLNGLAGPHRALPDCRVHELFEERVRAHPAARIARTLSRAGSRFVLTERGSTAMLAEALESLPNVEQLFVDAPYTEGHPDGDLGIPVAPDQLAYIYFTSGSTGEPKGAMCEHAGMLNHLFAKIADLGIGEGDVVAQTAPQCFDISLWQLVSALLVGGRTLIVEQETILDAPRFISKIVEGRVAVVQVVPSYL